MSSTAGVPESYTAARHDVAAMVPLTASRILELGCSTGSTAALLRARQPCAYTGIEKNAELANEARAVVDKILVHDLDDPAWAAGVEGPFDCIIAADVLEHLYDPWATLRQAVGLLDADGCVVLSLPNARHLQTILNLLRGRWPYRTRGVHDSTHLRFFTLREVRALCGTAGLRTQRLVRRRRILDRSGPWDVVARAAPLVGLGDLLTYQYILRAGPHVDADPIADESTPPWVHIPEDAERAWRAP